MAISRPLAPSLRGRSEAVIAKRVMDARVVEGGAYTPAERWIVTFEV